MNLYKIIKNTSVRVSVAILAAYWLLIFTLTTIPFSGNAFRWFEHDDKLKHFLAYFGLAFLLSIVGSIQKKYKFLKKPAYIIAIVLLYGVFDEVHQLFIPGRTFSVFDLMADLIGAVAGTIFSFHFIISKRYSGLT